MAFARDTPALLAARFAMGLGAGMCLPAVRRTIIVLDSGNVGANLGRAVTFDVFGFALGPVIAALSIGPLGIEAPFLISTAVMVMLLALLTRVPIDETDLSEAPSGRFAFDLLRMRAVAGAILIGLALFVLIGTFDSLWSIVMADMNAPTFIANVGIVVFVAPMVVLGSIGGRMAERAGPFRWSAAGLLIGAGCNLGYGLLPEPWMMLGVGVLHGINDGLTVTGTGIAVAMVVPRSRAASAQGLLGGLQTLTGGLVALAATAGYERFGRLPTFVSATIVMVALVALGYWWAGPARRLRGSAPTG
jgi:MFS family permease